MTKEELQQEIKYWKQQSQLRDQILSKYHNLNYRTGKYNVLSGLDQFKLKRSRSQIEDHIEKLQKQLQEIMYDQETFPDYIKFVEDTPQNREIFKDLLGHPKFILTTDFSYIEIDIQEKTWRTHLSVFWMYRNMPPLLDVVDVITLLK